MAQTRRIFLGWDTASGPTLFAAASILLGEAAEGDLSRHLVVTPGGRASRLLLGALLERSETTGQEPGPGAPLAPPRFCTPGELADILFSNAICPNPAGPLARRLAWVTALRSLSPQDLAPLIPEPPAPSDLQGWRPIAALLERAHDELAGELMLMGEVADRAAAALPRERGPFPDAERWHAAGLVQQAYLRVLAEAGLVDPGHRTVQLIREARSATSEFASVMLVGVPELGRAARAALGSLPDSTSVTAMVVAPEWHADRFDDFGAVIPDRWANAQIDIPEPRFAEGPQDQAHRALEAIAALGGAFAAHEIVIGVPDAEVVPHVERKAEAVEAVHGDERRPGALRVRAATGRPMLQTAPLRLLAAVREHAAHGTFAGFASLVRHPDVERHLVQVLAGGEARGAEWWLDELDCYQADHIPGAADGDWLTESARARQVLEALRASVQELLGDVVGGGLRPLHAWAAPLRKFLARVYGNVRLSRNDPTHRGMLAGNMALRDAIMEMERLGARDAAQLGAATCSVVQAIDMVLDIAGAGFVPEEGDEQSVELLGWLELPLDPAPVAILTGMNDGIVPASTTGDSLLPDSLREALGIASNRTRFARDLFNLAALCATRQVTLIAGRHSSDGSPLAPSRLLFACEPQRAVERISAFTSDSSPVARLKLALRVQPGSTSGFTTVPIIPTEAVTSLRVTSFRTFLASPYLCYLQDILGLEERNDRAVELDAMGFGSLLHDVLKRFGRSDARHSGDERRIEECLLDELSTIARRRYGPEPTVSVWLQLQFAGRRLREFAQFQAERRREGWLIEHVEWRPPAGPAPFPVDGEPFGLRGKIDRIERHETGSMWAVLDYKTGNEVSKPDTAHRGRAGWRDLQLPLYRHLAAALSLPQEPERLVLGYIALPRKPGGVALLDASWTAADLAGADEAARDVIRRVRRGEFREIGNKPPDDGIFAALCGVGFIGAIRRARAEEGEEE